MALWEGIALCRSENGGTETGSDLSEFLQWSQKLKLCSWESQLRARCPAVGTGQVAAPRLLATPASSLTARPGRPPGGPDPMDSW